jgi:hypothetical protein
LLNGAGRLLHRPKPLEPEEIWRAARAGDLVDRVPTPEATEALEVLLDSLARNVRLTPLGQLSARDDTIRLARTHLRIHRAWEQQPGFAGTPLPPAVFVVGWPRTGTTFLHQLLACDPAARSIPYWESFDPIPPPPDEPDLRIERLGKMLGQLRFLAPRYDAIHPMTPESPEECVALFMNELRTLQLDFQYRVPEYAAWLLGQDARIAYDLYRRQLQLIQHHRPAGAWQVLKDPTHLVHLETLVERFPDARFVFTHRDPGEALSSICSLVAYTRALFTDDVDPRAIGAELLEGYWPAALERSREIVARLPAERRVDVRHAALRGDPIGTVEGIYTALGLAFSDAARAAMAGFLADREARPTGRHVHSLEGFGLRREAVRERLAGYCAEVGV